MMTLINFELALIGILTAVALGTIVLSIWWQRRYMLAYEDGKMLNAMRRKLDELTERVVYLELALSEYQIGTARLLGQLTARNITPVWQPQKDIEIVAETGVRLNHLLAEQFNMEELNNLAFDIGIKPESFSGNTIEARALSLVEYAVRRGKLPDLLARCLELRPAVTWPAGE